MAKTLTGVIQVQHLKDTDFVFDESAKKIGTNNDRDVTAASLSGKNLILTRAAGNLTVDLSNLVPASKADIFLKAVNYDADEKKLKFTTGNKTNTDDDAELEVSVADLIPVTASDGLTGNGTTATPLKVLPVWVQTKAKEAATVTLQSAFGDDIALAFPV